MGCGSRRGRGARWTSSTWPPAARDLTAPGVLFVIIKKAMKLLRMKPGHGEIVLAEGDVEIPEQELELIEAFRRQLEEGMWAAVPHARAPPDAARRRWSRASPRFPRDADRVIFFPRAAAGGAPPGSLSGMALGPWALPRSSLVSAALGARPARWWRATSSPGRATPSRNVAPPRRRRWTVMTPAGSAAPSSARGSCCAPAWARGVGDVPRLGLIRVLGPARAGSRGPALPTPI